MKKMKWIALVWVILIAQATYGQQPADAIVGKWLKLPKEDMIIEVYKAKNGYNGKISWSKTGNDKPAGSIIIENLKYDPKKKEWVGGKIRDPKSSRSYSAQAKLNSENSLVVKGYMGMKFMSKSRTFSRVKK